MNLNKDAITQRSRKEIKRIRTELGFSLQKMADKLDLTSNQVFYAYETRTVNIADVVAYKLSVLAKKHGIETSFQKIKGF